MSSLDIGCFQFASPADGLGRGVANSPNRPRASRRLGDGARPLQKRFLDWNRALDPWRLAAGDFDIRLRDSVARGGRSAPGFGWLDALRECLRAGGTVSATGMIACALQRPFYVRNKC